MKISNKGINLITSFEGCVLTAYRCHAGVLTIGYGHTGSDVKVGMKITKAKAKELLSKDLARFEKNVMKYDSKYKWNQNQFDALVSFAYNIGSIDTLTANGSRTIAQISAKILAYDKAAGKTLPGLTRRRKAEKELFDKAVAKSTTSTKSTSNKDTTDENTDKQKVLKIGTKVKIKSGAKDINTKGKYASFVYKTVYQVHAYDSKYVIFGNGRVAVGKVAKSNIVLQ